MRGTILALSAASLLGIATLSGCSADGEQTKGCENLPIYDVSKPIDAGLQDKIDEAAAKGCITRPGQATPEAATK